ncbi:MAG: lamin tail domain-containing protein [Candidatus Bathyarchaeota archaeon]|nr:lamin tail domain-containing protein [Candidatus Bathyarchaeota archaeon]
MKKLTNVNLLKSKVLALFTVEKAVIARFHKRNKMSCVVCILSALLLTSTLWGVVQSKDLTVESVEDPWRRGKLGDAADVFFDDTYVHEIRLYFDDPNWYNTLYNAHDKDPADPYFPAKFVSHGITLNPVGVRFKGLSSFGGSTFQGAGNQGIKKPFRIDFNAYNNSGSEETTFFGLKKLSLSNGFADPTLMREKLFMDFASKYVPTPRSVHTRLYINDNYYGIYLAMEYIDNTFVESRFGKDETGNIYKAERGATLSYLGSDWRKYNGSYELKNNEDVNNWSDLIELTDILTNTPISELPAKLEPIFDVETGIHSLALLSLFSSLDSYIGNARNYYLYHRTDTGQFTYLLWDANLAFGNFRLILQPGENVTTLDPFPPSTMRRTGPQPPAGNTGNLTLIQNFLAVDSYNRTYLRAISKMIREGFNATSVNKRIQELANIIRNDVYSDPNFLSSKSAFEAGLTETTSFVQKRSAYLSLRLNDFAKKTDLKLNDLMTLNQNTLLDDNGDADPWVEICNLGPGLVTTENLFLTDSISIPNKWRLPSLSLKAGDYLLLWLDGEPSEGISHASFRLNSTGGELHLYWYSNSRYELVDTLTYPALNPDVSYGRFPNGEGSWLVLNEVVTPGTANNVGGIPTNLFINEFMANNDEAIPGPNNDYPDWIEIYNAANKTINVGGMYLTDDLANPTSWRIPEGTSIGAGGYLVVWADNSSIPGSLHASFSLNANGEKIGLFAADGKTLVDYVVFNQQIDDVSYGRLPDGSTNWTYLTPTPGSSNVLGKLVTLGVKPTAGQQPHIFINEVMANNDAAVPGPDNNYPDWVELYNGDTKSIDISGMYLSDNLTNPKWKFPEGTIMEPGTYLIVWVDNSLYPRPMHADFGLNASGEAVGLFAADGKTLIDSVTFGVQDDDISFGRFPDGAPNWETLTPTPGSSNKPYQPSLAANSTQTIEIPVGLFINEFMANNKAAVLGPNNDHPDWIELYNAANASINVGGMYLSDDLTNPDIWQFPPNTIIEPKSFLIIWADNSSTGAGLHATFRLNATGEAICLFAADKETLIDSIVFGTQNPDVSYGRLPDGNSNWSYLTPTPGMANKAGEVVATLVSTNNTVVVPSGLFINEFMADNQITIAGPDETYPDWIELFNASNETINLGGMYLTDSSTNPTKWRFPDGTTITPKGYLLIWADNSSEPSSLHAGFALNANGEEIYLFASDGESLIDSVRFDKQLSDVSYGRFPDGSPHWEHFLKATPGWGNNKPPANSEPSFDLILLLIGVILTMSVFVVGLSKVNSRLRK